MLIYPAIDLKDGQCVRLKLGHMDQATVYNDDPAAQARNCFATIRAVLDEAGFTALLAGGPDAVRPADTDDATDDAADGEASA